MPLFESSQEWLTQSALLFQAYPASSRVTTKYKIHPPPSAESRKRKRRPDGASGADANDTPSQATPASNTAASAQPAAPRATLTLKSYDPVSGVCLKYRTDKAAEVGRLVAGLSRLGKHMAAIPGLEAEAASAEADKAVVVDAEGAEKPTAAAEQGITTVEGETKPAQQQPQSGKPGGGGGANKKKKKGKK